MSNRWRKGAVKFGYLLIVRTPQGQYVMWDERKKLPQSYVRITQRSQSAIRRVSR